MMITIAGIDFDYQDYDERGDVLFLHVGKPTEPPGQGVRDVRGAYRRIRRALAPWWAWS
jgi:hypothetical protein